MSLRVKKLAENSTIELERVFLRDFAENCICREGHCYFGEKNVFLASHYEDIYQKVFDFEVRDDDTFILTFPKTGTTWSQEMLWLLANNLDYEGAKTPLVHRFPFMEIQGFFAHNQSTEWMNSIMLNSLNDATNMPSPRFIKSHLPWELLPKQIQNGTKSPKLIYVCRNPKDCVVSYYNHSILIEGYKGTFDNFFKFFINDMVNYAPFWGHLLEYWKRRIDSNILFLRYEELKADLPAVINKAAAFLGKSYSEDEVNKLAVHLSFDSMKNNPAVNYDIILETGRNKGLFQADRKFMRSGKVGDFKTQMSPVQIAEMDKWSEEAIKGTDFEPFSV